MQIESLDMVVGNIDLTCRSRAIFKMKGDGGRASAAPALALAPATGNE